MARKNDENDVSGYIKEDSSGLNKPLTQVRTKIQKRPLEQVLSDNSESNLDKISQMGANVQKKQKTVDNVTDKFSNSDTDKLAQEQPPHYKLTDGMKKVIESSIHKLKEGINDEKTYDHIMASILEIKDKKLSHLEVLEQLEQEIDGLSDHLEFWGHIYSLSTFVDGSNICLSEYSELATQDPVFKQELSGEVCDFICEHI